MTTRVFIDGAAGTTGLEIADRLAGRPEFAVATLGERDRKDSAARADAFAAADVAILCLPDDAAREAAALARTLPVRLIDASSAHRTDPDWTYGFPELAPGRRDEIAGARRVSNPGCYPTGFLALVAPLVRAGVLPTDAPLTVHAASGYSGGGNAMIAAFEAVDANADAPAFHAYGLGLSHKHVPEMTVQAGLSVSPIFSPSVARTYRGMIVEVPLHLSLCASDTTGARVRDILRAAYADSPLVTVDVGDTQHARVAIEHLAGSDALALFVFANEAAGHLRLVAALDNLGKGAAGAAVQNLNIMSGLAETTGLRLVR